MRYLSFSATERELKIHILVLRTCKWLRDIYPVSYFLHLKIISHGGWAHIPFFFWRISVQMNHWYSTAKQTPPASRITHQLCIVLLRNFQNILSRHHENSSPEIKFTFIDSQSFLKSIFQARYCHGLHLSHTFIYLHIAYRSLGHLKPTRFGISWHCSYATAAVASWLKD